MFSFSEQESKITDQYQTTLPAQVRQQLRVRKGDQIVYRLEEKGRVYIEATQPEHLDPVITAFLNFLERDMQQSPEVLKPLDPALMSDAQDLVQGVEVDLTTALPSDDH